MNRGLLHLLLCLVLAFTGTPAWAHCRPENRVGGSPVFSSNFTFADDANPIAASGENPACGYDFASGVHKYLYGADNPVNRIDPSGHDDIGDVLGAMDIGFSLAAITGPSISGRGAVSIGSTCGPDVTAAVLNTTIDIEQTFLNAPFSVQAQAVNNIYTPAIGDGWDIDPLASLGFGGRPDFGNGSTLGSGSGERTVQFGNPPKVYYAGSLNYILWGRMFRLAAVKFGNPLTGSGAPAYSEVAAEAAAWTYKSVFWRDFGDSKREADAFVHFGYDGTDPSSTALPLTPNPKNVGASARFDWKWIGLHDVAQ